MYIFVCTMYVSTLQFCKKQHNNEMRENEASYFICNIASKKNIFTSPYWSIKIKMIQNNMRNIHIVMNKSAERTEKYMEIARLMA